VRLAASQVIERPPAEVSRFVAAEHFQNHNQPKWDPAVTSIPQTSPGLMGAGTTARLVRTDLGQRGDSDPDLQSPDRLDLFRGSPELKTRL
jgi:hypothetical protein